MEKLPWQTLTLSAFSAPDDRLAGWLLDPHSFMQRLRRAGVQDARVHVIKQAWEFPAWQELDYLGLQPRRYALVREVLIASPATPWMFARSVIPRATLTGREQLLARLKNRALGTMLFNNPRVERSEFEFTQVQRDEKDYHKIWQLCQLDTPALMARRSMFYLPVKKLLLTEVFFPTLMELSL